MMLVFVLYPCFLACRLLIACSSVKSSILISKSKPLPRVSIITVSHKAAELLDEKIKNIQQLDYPHHLLEFVFFSDGSSENTCDIQARLRNIQVKQLFSKTHRGKAYGLNRAVEQSTGEILVFSDIDAIINKGAVILLVSHFQDTTIGGVCGHRAIAKEKSSLQSAQSRYLAFDNLIKSMEGRTGSLTSNEGKLYAIRRSLFQPIDPAATDDLYNCLSVVKAKYRFVFEPEAYMYIRSPSRSLGHEIQRRRRIVARSLHGIAKHKEVLNPVKFGWYSPGLFINKILRRCLPVFLMGIFLSTLFLSLRSEVMLVILILQLVFYGTALLYPLTAKRSPKLVSLITYFILGNYGTFLGIIDFLTGKRITKWIPIKSDE
ncbi:glycosyltransferase [Candidatus Pacearchaeota archaeon]|nr:glycosyltransferase [Candidatus Pacearchaeota archaeon]